MKRNHKNHRQRNTHNFSVLALDITGAPRKWLAPKAAVEYYVAEKVAWDFGEHSYTMIGGTQAATGELSTITTKSIIAIRGAGLSAASKDRAPPVTRPLLFARDKYICAYCCNRYEYKQLEKEHIVPIHHRGDNSWTNLITSCAPCNDYKKNRTPH